MLQLLKNLASWCCGPARIDADEEQQASALELSERATSGQPPSDQLLPLSTTATPVGLQQAITSTTPPAVAPTRVSPAVAELDAPSPSPCRPPSPPPSDVSPTPSLTASSPPAPPLLALPSTFGRAPTSHSHTPAPPPSRATSTHLVSPTSSPETLHSPLFPSDTPLRRTQTGNTSVDMSEPIAEIKPNLEQPTGASPAEGERSDADGNVYVQADLLFPRQGCDYYQKHADEIEQRAALAGVTCVLPCFPAKGGIFEAETEILCVVVEDGADKEAVVKFCEWLQGQSSLKVEFLSQEQYSSCNMEHEGGERDELGDTTEGQIVLELSSVSEQPGRLSTGPHAACLSPHSSASVHSSTVLFSISSAPKLESRKERTPSKVEEEMKEAALKEHREEPIEQQLCSIILEVELENEESQVKMQSGCSGALRRFRTRQIGKGQLLSTSLEADGVGDGFRGLTWDFNALPRPEEPPQVEESTSTTGGHTETTGNISKDPGLSFTWKSKQTTSGTTTTDKASTDWTRRPLRITSPVSGGQSFVPPAGGSPEHILTDVRLEILTTLEVKNKRACVEGGAQIYWPADAHKKVFPGINVIYAVVLKITFPVPANSSSQFQGQALYSHALAKGHFTKTEGTGHFDARIRTEEEGNPVISTAAQHSSTTPKDPHTSRKSKLAEAFRRKLSGSHSAGEGTSPTPVPDFPREDFAQADFAPMERES